MQSPFNRRSGTTSPSSHLPPVPGEITHGRTAGTAFESINITPDPPARAPDDGSSNTKLIVGAVVVLGAVAIAWRYRRRLPTLVGVRR